MRFRKHVFVCTNQKVGDKPCCGEVRGTEILNKLKLMAKENGLLGEIRIQKAGCLDACNHGPAMVVYPEGTYYGNVGLDDLKDIINEHLIHDKVVERLELKF